MQSSESFGKKVDTVGDSLYNLAIGNGHLICVRNIEGHIAPHHTVLSYVYKDIYIYTICK